MKSSKQLRRLGTSLSLATIVMGGLLAPTTASAIDLKATAGGTVVFDYDVSAYALFGYANPPGGCSVSQPCMPLTNTWNTAASNYANPTLTDGYFVANHGTTPLSGQDLIHDITPTGSNPTGQASGRFVKATTAAFKVNSDTLTGAGVLGMTGVEAFFLPYYGTSGGTLLYGDLSIHYNQALRQGAWDDAGDTGTASGWYVNNNISFTAPAYDLANLVVAFTDANNWSLSADLLLTPENADFIGGAHQQDVGNICVGVGSYAGCGVSAVPVPGAVWLFGTGLIGFIANSRRKLMNIVA